MAQYLSVVRVCPNRQTPTASVHCAQPNETGLFTIIVSSQIRSDARALTFTGDSSNDSAKPADQTDVPTAVSRIQSNIRGFSDSSALRDAILSGMYSRETLDSSGTEDEFVEQFSSLAKDKAAFHSVLRDVFGDNYDAQAGEIMRRQALAGDFSWMPDTNLLVLKF